MDRNDTLADDRSIADRWFAHGRALALDGRFRDALEPLERALAYSVDESDLGYLARLRSWLGVTIAMTGGSATRARNLCEEAVYVRPRDAELYVNLARVFVHADRRDLAIACCQTAIALAPDHEGAVGIIRQFGLRRKPVFGFLDRSNPVNKYVGLLRHRLAS